MVQVRRELQFNGDIIEGDVCHSRRLDGFEKRLHSRCNGRSTENVRYEFGKWLSLTDAQRLLPGGRKEKTFFNVLRFQETNGVAFSLDKI